MTTDICSYCSNDDPSKSLWVQCELCPQWVHVECVPLKHLRNDSDNSVTTHPTSASQIVKFSCENHGEVLLQVKQQARKRKQKDSPPTGNDKKYGLRKKKKIDYIALNEGEDRRLKDEHPHIPAFLKCFDKWSNTTNIISSESLETTFDSITVPLKVKDPENSGMKIPTVQELGRENVENESSKITVNDIARVLGDDYPLDVMDVQTQQNSDWTISQWNNYFSETPTEQRDRIRNVISLEVSHVQQFRDGIRRPTAVEVNDLADLVWEDVIDKKSDVPRPKVTKYILMSVGNAYTDFHLDFAGTSVYYNVISGKKKFILFPPTIHNLGQYKRWCDSDHQNLVFLGDMLEDGVAMELNSGDLFMIPCGYIHAVYTPIDSLVVGGNFLTLRDITTQLKIVEIERLTKVPKRFTFPHFDIVMGKTCEWVLKHRKAIPDEHIKTLISHMSDPKVKYKPVNYRNKKELLQELEKRVSQLQTSL